MSEICEHPFCTHSISRKCSNHCQLDLCEEHLTEHKNLFLVQYEKSFNNLTKSLHELIYSIEEIKNNRNLNYDKEISLIHETYQNKSNEIESKIVLLSSTKTLIKKKSQLLTDVKNNQAILYQYDIEQLRLHHDELREYHHEKIVIKTNQNDVEMSSSNSTSDDDKNDDADYIDENYQKSPPTNARRNDIMYFRAPCPLTHLGIYGLDQNHNLRLCPSGQEDSTHLLISHFHNYHHLTHSLAYQLTKAIINQANPLTTRLFQSEKTILDHRYDVIGCPLNKLKLSDCKTKLFKNSLKLHLLNVHHATLETSNRIVETIINQGDLTKLDLDEDEFK